jgi:hypothetical protein
VRRPSPPLWRDAQPCLFLLSPTAPQPIVSARHCPPTAVVTAGNGVCNRSCNRLQWDLQAIVVSDALINFVIVCVYSKAVWRALCVCLARAARKVRERTGRTNAELEHGCMNAHEPARRSLICPNPADHKVYPARLQSKPCRLPNSSGNYSSPWLSLSFFEWSYFGHDNWWASATPPSHGFVRVSCS